MVLFSRGNCTHSASAHHFSHVYWSSDQTLSPSTSSEPGLLPGMKRWSDPSGNSRYSDPLVAGVVSPQGQVWSFQAAWVPPELQEVLMMCTPEGNEEENAMKKMQELTLKLIQILPGDATLWLEPQLTTTGVPDLKTTLTQTTTLWTTSESGSETDLLPRRILHQWGMS